MQQQSLQMMKTPPGSISTEEVQKLLDENKSLILAILENQNIGKSTECALYQAQLQNNLMFLAAIADAQPTVPTVPSQNPLQSVVQQEHYMQQAEAATPQQQPNPKFPFQLNNTPLQSRDQQHQLLLQQQQIAQGQGHMGMVPGANTSLHQALQTGLGSKSGLIDTQGSRQDAYEAVSRSSLGKLASGRGSGGRGSKF